jgi:hypothetical protein
MAVEGYRSERLRCGGVELSLSQQMLSTKWVTKPLDRDRNACYTLPGQDPLANVRIIQLAKRAQTPPVAGMVFASERLKLVTVSAGPAVGGVVAGMVFASERLKLSNQLLYAPFDLSSCRNGFRE